MSSSHDDDDDASNGQSSLASNQLIEALRLVNDAFTIGGYQWDDELAKIMEYLNLATPKKKEKRKKDSKQPIRSNVEDFKIVASVILFSSATHLANLNGKSRQQIGRLRRELSRMASQKENDSLRTAIGKSQLRLIKKVKNSDPTSVTICIGTFINLIAAAPEINIFMSNGSIQTAFIETLSLLNDVPNSPKIRIIKRVAMLSSSVRSLLISLVTKNNSSKIICPSLILILSSMVEAVLLDENKNDFPTNDISKVTSQSHHQLRKSDVYTATEVIQVAWTVCLETKPCVAPSIVAAFDPFFRCLTSNDLTNPPVNLLAVCSKHLRRTAETSLPLLARLFCKMKVDLSATAPSLISETGLLDCLKSEKPALQSSARRFLIAIISQVSDPSSIAQCLKIFYEPLQKGQAVKVHEKLGLIEAFHGATLCRYIPSCNIAEILPQFFNPTGYFLAKGPTKAELQENVRHATLLVTGRFLQICSISGEIARSICELYHSILIDIKSSDRLRHSVISALVLALDKPLDCSKVNIELLRPFVGTIINLISNQAAKPTARLMCLEALLFLVRIERLHSNIFSDIPTTAILSLIGSSSSFLNSLVLIGKAPPSEVSVQLQLSCLMFLLPSSSALGVPYISSDSISDSIQLTSEANKELKKAVVFPPVTPIDMVEQDAHFRPFFRSFVALLASLFERNLWSIEAETLSDMSHSGVTGTDIPKSNRLNLHQSFTRFGNAPKLLRLITRGLYDFLTSMQQLQLNSSRSPKQCLSLAAPLDPVLFVDLVPSPSTLRRTLKSILLAFSDCVIDGAVDDMPTLFSLCACHPLVNSIQLFQVNSNASLFVDQFMLHPKRDGTEKHHAQQLTIGPNLARIPQLLAYLQEIDPTNDCYGYRAAFIALLGLVDPKVSLQLEQNRQQLPGGYSHNEIVACCQVIGDQLASGLSSEKLTTLEPQEIQLYFAPEGILFIEKGIYIAQEVENKNIKLNKYQKELYGDAVVEVMKLSYGSIMTMCFNQTATRPKLLEPKVKSKSKTGSTTTKEANKTRADIENEEIMAQTERRNRIHKEVSRLQFIMKCLGTLCIVYPGGIQDIMPQVVKGIIDAFKCPLSFSTTLYLARIVCHQFIPSTVLPTPHLVPNALSRSALQSLPIQDETIEMLKEVSSSVSLSRPAALLLQPIVNFILQNPSISGPKSCLAALEFLVKQLKTDNPQVVADETIICVGAILRSQPGRVTLGSVALDAICSKLLDERLVPLVAEIGRSDDPTVRYAVVSALRRSRCTLNNANAFIYCLKFDIKNVRTAELTDVLREEFGLGSTTDMLTEIESFLGSESDEFRIIAATAFAHATKELNDVGLIEISTMIQRLIDNYRVSKDPQERSGFVAALTQMCRIDLVKTEEDFGAIFKFLIGFALNDGFLSTSSEFSSGSLLSSLQVLGLDCISSLGKNLMCDMNALVEEVQANVVNEQGLNGGNRGAVDAAVALFLGAIAKFMDPSDPTVKRIFDRLLLRIGDPTTPSRNVQRSIADVLPPLVKSCQTSNQVDPKALMERILNEALTNESLVSRNGYVLALAAIVKGLGIVSIKENDLIKKLIDAAEDKDNTLRRQGALSCFEALSELLGRLFEPYIAHILSTLLSAFSDGAQPVRAAAQKAANVIMGQLSGHGVKLVLPNLLTKVTDKQWRTKLGSIELLGAMAHCAPKQLAALLPQVVPQLCEVVNDSNPKVKEAAREALQTIASVISNQEIHRLSNVLLTALIQPSNENAVAALDALLKTEFVNPVDSPSLALICPIVVRALRERGSETKKKASAIVASMVYLCHEPKDFLPYFPQVGPQLQETLLDPIPDVRSVASKALGTIAKGLGDENLGDLVPWLLSKLRSHESTVERSGAANGLSEVLAALGVEKLAELLPSILQNAEYASSDVREGYLGLFVFLPGAFGQEFQRFVPEVLPVLLRGLSSEVESLRDVAFRAAEVLVVQYGASHSVLLLSPLEDGVFNSDWRIRHSSVSLLGTLIDRLLRFAPGFTGNLLETEVLSLERRAFILSSLYIVRSDENAIVRQAATTAWKEVVQNTPKTLKEILPILLKRLVSNLAASSPDKQKAASRCIGELSSKLPERVLPELIPSCLEILKRPGVAPRHGACIGLSEMIQHAPKASLLIYTTQIIPAIQGTLCDESNAVRQAGTQCLRHLLNGLGPESLDSIVNDILTSVTCPPTYNVDDLERGPRAAQLSGLEVLIETQTQTLLPAVLSKCLSSPSDLAKLRLMGSVSAVRNHNTIINCLPKLLPGLIKIGVLGLMGAASGTIPQIQGIEDETVLEHFNASIIAQEVGQAASKLFKKVPDEGVQSLLDTLTQTLLQDVAPLGDLSSCGKHKIQSKLIELGIESDCNIETDDDLWLQFCSDIIEKDSENPYRRAMIAQLIDVFIQTTSSNITSSISNLLSIIVPMALCDPADIVQEKAVQTFLTLANIIKKHDPVGQVTELRSIISRLITNPVSGKDDKDLTLRGLARKNALEGFYSLYHSGLVASGTEIRELSAHGFSELIAHCPEEALKPVAVKLTGPLIRAAAERVPSAVKAAVINTLRVLLIKAGPFLKPLLPQLQISFVKAIPDPSIAVRRSAASGLACLAESGFTRTEALVSELCANTALQPDASIKASILTALADVLAKLPQKCSETAQSKIISTTEALLYSKGLSEGLKMSAAECLGALLARHLGPEKLSSYLSGSLQSSLTSQDTDTSQGAAMLLSEIVVFPDIWNNMASDTELLLSSLLESLLTEERTTLRKFGVVGFGRLVASSRKSAKALLLAIDLLKTSSTSINSFSSTSGISVLQIGLKSFKRLARLSITNKESIQFDVTQKSFLLLPAINSLTLPHPGIKLLAERVIFYALDVPGGEEFTILDELQHSKSVDPQRLQLLNEYTRRVLSKMAKSFSDSEED